MKKCPYCGEMIQDSAIKCRYCGEWLEKPLESIAVSEANNNSKEELTNPSSKNNANETEKSESETKPSQKESIQFNQSEPDLIDDVPLTERELSIFKKISLSKDSVNLYTWLGFLGFIAYAIFILVLAFKEGTPNYLLKLKCGFIAVECVWVIPTILLTKELYMSLKSLNIKGYKALYACNAALIAKILIDTSTIWFTEYISLAGCILWIFTCICAGLNLSLGEFNDDKYLKGSCFNLYVTLPAITLAVLVFMFIALILVYNIDVLENTGTSSKILARLLFGFIIVLCACIKKIVKTQLGYRYIRILFTGGTK